MGVIKNVKITPNNKVEYTVVVDYEEDLLNKGHKTNAHVFSEEAVDIKTNLVSRGRGNTKYIKLPRTVAKDVRTNSNVECLRLDSKDKIIIFTVIEK